MHWRVAVPSAQLPHARPRRMLDRREAHQPGQTIHSLSDSLDTVPVRTYPSRAAQLRGLRSARVAQSLQPRGEIRCVEVCSPDC